ncbi:MAG: hypothetical protein H0W16_07300 [Actinobacteria bacterium]|nr:hypothetical protein [Actinomycetota bacterium]
MRRSWASLEELHRRLLANGVPQVELIGRMGATETPSDLSTRLFVASARSSSRSSR